MGWNGVPLNMTVLAAEAVSAAAWLAHVEALTEEQFSHCFTGEMFCPDAPFLL